MGIQGGVFQISISAQFFTPLSCDPLKKKTPEKQTKLDFLMLQKWKVEFPAVAVRQKSPST